MVLGVVGVACHRSGRPHAGVTGRTPAVQAVVRSVQRSSREPALDLPARLHPSPTGAPMLYPLRPPRLPALMEKVPEVTALFWAIGGGTGGGGEGGGGSRGGGRLAPAGWVAPPGPRLDAEVAA